VKNASRTGHFTCKKRRYFSVESDLGAGITNTNQLQIQYNSNPRLDLNWSWIGVELELLQPYIEKQTRYSDDKIIT
jgi:hypothetical protein